MSAIRYRRLAIAYCLLIIFVSSIPGRTLHFRLLNWDKMFHLAEYSILGWLLIRSLEQRTLPGVTGVILMGCCFGMLDELWQHFVSGRSGQFYDWMADSAGVLVGSAVVLLPERFLKTNKAIEQVEDKHG